MPREEEEQMGELAFLQSMVTVNDTWVDYFIIGVYFVFVLGIGAMLTAVFIIIDPVFGSRSAKTTPPRLRA